MKTELPPIGQYELQQLLARTSTGEVWRAFDIRPYVAPAQ
jgi:hypothetical protein